MKKLLTIFLCLLLALSVAGCGHNKGFDPSDVSMEVIEGSVTPSSISVRINNNSKTDITGGIDYDFSIETKSNGEWSPVEAIGERTTNYVTYVFQGERELDIHWSELYGTLPQGEYRIVKFFAPWSIEGTYDSGDGFYLTAEFVVEY